MKNNLILKKIKNLSSLFISDERGAIAVIFAVMVIPMMALAGAAIDYSQATSIKNQIQTSADSAALAGGRAFAQSDDEDYISDIAKKVFAQNMVNSGFAGTIEPTVIFLEDGIRVEATTTMPTKFLQLVGMSSLSVGTFSEIEISAAQLEVALVLDTTYSMDGSKLRALKRSATMMINTLMTKDDGGSVKVGLVPFSRYVNIGMSNRNEPGINVPADYTNGEHCTNNCSWRRVPGSSYSCTNDGAPATCWRWETYNCGTLVCYPKNYRWHGCVGSRNNPLDVRDDRYGANPVPGLLDWRPQGAWNNLCQTAPLTRLTDHKSSVISGISSMSADDSTYIPSGLAWGWRILSAQEPFSDAEPASDEITKVLVLMTDGENTVSPSYPLHDQSDENEANDLTQDLCVNIKDDDIIVYTIAFDVSDNTIESILESCAGNGGRYFDANNASDLEDAFKLIAKDLMDLRLTR